jgi:hypothetical protein
MSAYMEGRELNEAEMIALARIGTLPAACLSAEARQKFDRGEDGDGPIADSVAETIGRRRGWLLHLAAEDKRVKRLLLSRDVADAEKVEAAGAHWFLIGDERRGDFLTWCFCRRFEIGAAPYGRVLAESWDRPKVGSLATAWGFSWKLVNKMFLAADRRHLMNDAELEFFSALPDSITLYRGSGNNVTPNRAARGMSWTLDLEKAQWFAQRDGDGFCLKAQVPKRNAFAYFDGRDEQEVVVRYASVRRFEVVNAQ